MKPIAIALLCPPMMAATQSPFGFAPVTLVALMPWLWATRHINARSAIALGALVGTSYGSLTVLWIPEALSKLGSSDSTAVMGLIATAAWAKLPLFAVAGWTAHRLRDYPAVVQIAGVGLAFGLGEWLIGSWSLGVPYSLVGHSQLPTLGIAQLAVVGGVPLISGWIVSINVSLALAISGDWGSRRLAIALTGGWFIMASAGLPVAELVRTSDSDAARVALLIVQPNLPRSARWDNSTQPWILDEMASHTSEALTSERDGVQAILWPENLLTDPIERAPDLSEALQRHVDEWDIPVITGLVRSPTQGQTREYRSSVVWIEPQSGIAATLDKFRAIPLLESSRPLLGKTLLTHLFGRAASWHKVEEAPTVGSAMGGRFMITPVLCYEALFPWIVEARRSPDSVAILNLADDSWVSGKTASRQLADAATFRAIEQRLGLIRVAHGGISLVVDEYGRTVLELPTGEWAHARISVTQTSPPTHAERASLVALPIVSSLGIWWILGAWTRRDPRELAMDGPTRDEPPT